MSFVDQILEDREFVLEMKQFEEECDKLEEEFVGLKERFEKLNEGPTDFKEGMSVGEIFDEAEKRLKTAKWALGLTNKLKKPEDRKKHRRNVMIALNKLNGLIRKLARKLTKEVPQDQNQQRPQGEGRYNDQQRGANMGQRRPAMAT